MDTHVVTPQHQLGPISDEQQQQVPAPTKDALAPLTDEDMWKDIASISSHSDTTITSASSTNSSLTSSNSKPLPPPLNEELPPSKRQLIAGHLRSIIIAFLRWASKGNNWALIINLLHHLWGARKLVFNKKYYYRTLKETQPIARDAVHASVGAMHLTFATLTGLAMKHRRLSTDRSTLLVLTLAAIGQAWAYAVAFWNSGAKYTIRGLRHSGALDAVVFAVSSIAFSKTVRRSGRLL
ncbi:hypothetical protein BDB00DRAFT_845882 [Zychaea mexicana]|uniref:uncharacterized protein n=1 Tax=Zychaea mexicana TaxID=64656 RepID=UPI0022FEF580|nr:uncharacterized protein BDB00DRAFT_845882 [Zychaea mexicana]KAI9488946.1 hypothetical protein BDB00DRAFT_845882 [Zychaea mexicana]